MTDTIYQQPAPPPSTAPATTVQKTSWWKKEFHLSSPIKPEEVMNFSRQAASFLRAGIPVLDALVVISEDNGNKHMVALLDDVRRNLRAGTGLADALAQHPKVFPGYYVAMVRSAELTGRLDAVFDQLALYIERDLDARRKIKSAMTYPAVIAGVAAVAVVVLALYVLPKFADLFGELDADLPLTTKALLNTSDFIEQWWWVLVGGILLVILTGLLVLGGRRGKPRRDRLVLRLPAVGQLMHFVILERWSRVLGATVHAGVPLPDALIVASESTNNRVYQEKLAVVRDEMMRGGGLARPITQTGLFPAAARQMIRVGESTGTLDLQLDNTAAFYERELGYKLKRFTDLFEPAIIIAVGVVVGFIALALVQAMYGVFDKVDV